MIIGDDENEVIVKIIQYLLRTGQKEILKTVILHSNYSIS